MKVLLDTNVLLDVALARQPHLAASEAVLNWGEAHPGSAAIAWHSVSNLYYILRKANDDATARQFIQELLMSVDVVPSGTAQAKHALALTLPDFEDALQAAAAVAAGVDLIVTRNTADFVSSPVPAVTPEAFTAGR